MDTNKLRKAASAVYLVAAPEVVAHDLSKMLIEAADTIDELQKTRDSYDPDTQIDTLP